MYSRVMSLWVAEQSGNGYVGRRTVMYSLVVYLRVAGE